jgi:hypothetical protein
MKDLSTKNVIVKEEKESSKAKMKVKIQVLIMKKMPLILSQQRL